MYCCRKNLWRRRLTNTMLFTCMEPQPAWPNQPLTCAISQLLHDINLVLGSFISLPLTSGYWPPSSADLWRFRDYLVPTDISAATDATGDTNVEPRLRAVKVQRHARSREVWRLRICVVGKGLTDKDRIHYDPGYRYQREKRLRSATYHTHVLSINHPQNVNLAQEKEQARDVVKGK